MPDYLQTYLAKSDDELLNLAAQQSSLLPEAQLALTAALKERRLSGKDVEEQNKWRDEVKIDERHRKPLSFSFNGFGTTIYGKREFEADGSFVTTKWIVLAWIPIFPLRSLRIVPIGEPSTNFVLWSSGNYRTVEEFRPNLRQVVFTYLYTIVLILAVFRLFSMRFSEPVFWIMMALWGCVPWLLRIIAYGFA